MKMKTQLQKAFYENNVSKNTSPIFSDGQACKKRLNNINAVTEISITIMPKPKTKEDVCFLFRYIKCRHMSDLLETTIQKEYLDALSLRNSPFYFYLAV